MSGPGQRGEVLTKREVEVLRAIAQGHSTKQVAGLLGITFKGCIWAFAYRSENPGCSRWIYRPLMSLMTVVLFSMLLPYSLLTIRRGAWSRG